jgi:SH3-like domain-containing protein
VLRRTFIFAFFLALALSIAGCKRNSAPKEKVYVAAQQVTLRDRVADVYNKVGNVKNGDALEVLERSKNKRWLRVRNAAQEEGWIEQKYIVDDVVYRAVAKLAADNRKALVQGHAAADTDLRMRVEPQRDADFLYMLKEKDKVELLKRASTEKPNKQPPPAEQPKNAKPPEPVYEDWWLVRNAEGRVGWVVARNIDVEVPMEVAEYAEGRKIVAWFKLNEVHSTKEKDSKMVPQYLMALSDPKGGLPYDFDQIRVFTWNQKRERYETAYREHLIGDLPIQVATQDFGKDGHLPVFTLRAREDDKSFQERKYSLNGVMVRRVLAPGETPPAKSRPVRH